MYNTTHMIVDVAVASGAPCHMSPHPMSPSLQHEEDSLSDDVENTRWDIGVSQQVSDGDARGFLAASSVGGDEAEPRRMASTQ